MIAITGKPTSALAKLADVHIDCTSRRKPAR